MNEIHKEYVKFFINGGILGLVAWGGQYAIYHFIVNNDYYTYALSSAFAYVPLVLINFSLQRIWIFRVNGSLFRFIVANLLMMIAVSFVAVLMNYLINLKFNQAWAERLGYPIASLIVSVPSFFLKRNWVFSKGIKY